MGRQVGARDRVRLLDFGDFKDPSGLYLDDPDRFAERFQTYLDEAVSWTERVAREATREAAEAFELARDLLRAPDLLKQAGELMQERGYAGDVGPPKLGYVAMSSRELPKPMNLNFVGPSAVGKNRAVDAAAELMPPEALYIETAGSARALIYAE